MSPDTDSASGGMSGDGCTECHQISRGGENFHEVEASQLKGWDWLWASGPRGWFPWLPLGGDEVGEFDSPLITKFHGVFTLGQLQL
jgi:hypothetical protein